MKKKKQTYALSLVLAVCIPRRVDSVKVKAQERTNGGHMVVVVGTAQMLSEETPARPCSAAGRLSIVPAHSSWFLSLASDDAEVSFSTTSSLT
jgi:hypothetical protein